MVDSFNGREESAGEQKQKGGNARENAPGKSLIR